MDFVLVFEATREGATVALFTIEFGPHRAHVVFFRLEHAGGARTEQWCRVADDYRQAVELYQRGVEDFIYPVPFVPAEPQVCWCGAEPPCPKGCPEPSFVGGGT